MSYRYYPGCSLEGTAKEYDISVRSTLAALGVEIAEIPDWTCCGASAAEATDGLLSLALPAVNLALAAKMEEKGDVLAPCSACYLNLKKVEKKVEKDDDLRKTLDTILAEKSLELPRKIRVRHLLDVLATDVGAERIRGAVKSPLSDWSIAPYYGCQCLRPYVEFDDPERPTSMEPLIEATGARVHPWEMGGQCCGAANMNTKPEAAAQLVIQILRAARGADAIVTVCPMCQMNLEGYQGALSRQAGRELSIPVLYLPQLLGLAMGLPESDLRIGLNLSPAGTLPRRLRVA
jgi:heterodisulfide reductase subunit B